MIRRFGLALAVLPLLATLFLAGTASAQAAVHPDGGWGCSGNEVSDSPYNIYDGGTIISQVHLYYDSSTGDNCAVNVKAGSLYGDPTYTSVDIYACNSSDPNNCTVNTEQQDPTDQTVDYRYYAGPVTVYGAGVCIGVDATTTDSDGLPYGGSWGPFHCG